MYSGIPSRRTLFEGASGEMYPGGLLRPHSRVICEGAELVEETWVGVVDLGGAHSRGSSSAFFFFFLLVPDGGVAVASRGSTM